MGVVVASPYGRGPICCVALTVRVGLVQCVAVCGFRLIFELMLVVTFD